MSLCLLGAITGAHGIRGWLKVEIYSDIENRLSYLDTVLVGKKEARAMEMQIEASREDGRTALLKLKAVDDRNAAEALFGYSLFIPDEQMLPPPDGMHYIHDLIGCKVVDAETGEDRGTVTDVMLLPANDVYVVECNGQETLVPAVPEFIRMVDTDNKRITVAAVPGLFAEEDEN